MANGVDESAFLGSAVDTMPVVSRSEESEKKVDAIKEKRKSVYARLSEAVDTLLPLIETELAKEDSLSAIRDRSLARVKQGVTPREAISDELLYSQGRVDAFRQIKLLLAQSKQAKGGRGE